MMENTYHCTDCKRGAKIVYDHPTGATVCVECGLVLVLQSDHETSELEKFPDQNVENHIVCNRHASDRILIDGGTPTDISEPNGGFLPSSSRINYVVVDLEDGSDTISILCCKLNLSKTIRAGAIENYRKVKGNKSIKKVRKYNALLAACIDIACQQEGDKRTSKEICSVVDGIKKVELGQAKNWIKKEFIRMGENLEIKFVSAGDCLRRYCSCLGMEDQAIKAAEEAVEKSEELDIRRSPQTIAAAVIYLVNELSNDQKLSLKDISDVVDVGQHTIRLAYRNLYPYASTLIPSWYAKEEDIIKLTQKQNQYYSL